MSQANLLTSADAYLTQGLSVIPLREGKLPGIRWKEHQGRLATRQELSSWFVGEKRFWGIALVCGAVSGNLARIDFDDPDDWASILAKRPDLAKTFPVFQSQRAGGGYGLLFRSREPIPTLPQKSFDGYPQTEVRGEGSITVVPPTD